MAATMFAQDDPRCRWQRSLNAYYIFCLQEVRLVEYETRAFEKISSIRRETPSLFVELTENTKHRLCCPRCRFRLD